MSWTKLIDIICDHCHSRWDGNADTVGDARRQAREDGWRYRHGEDLCPECAGTEGRGEVAW